MEDWSQLLKSEKQSTHFQKALSYSQQRRKDVDVYPPADQVFEAFVQTPLSQLKVVILGQDPYHGEGQAHGLCFSVNKAIKIPPSLRNIYKELNSDVQVPIPNHGCLTHWAQQGVLLLNSVLTVESGNANSHKNIGWETFTDSVIQLISEHTEHLVFMLWGSSAHAKVPLIDTHKHTVLKAVHPSPLSAYRGFFGCQHFSKTNHSLIHNDQTVIDWSLPE